MVVRLETQTLAPDQRNEAARQMLALCGMPVDVSHACAAEQIRTQLAVWQLGAVSVIRFEGSHLHLRSQTRHTPGAAETMVSMSLHEQGTATARQRGGGHLEWPGQLYLHDFTQPFELAWADRSSKTILVQVSHDHLGLSVDVVRRAGPRLIASPVHALVRRHLAAVTRHDELTAGSPVTDTIGAATVELMRALICSAGKVNETRAATSSQQLRTCLAAYLRQHLHDPDLSAEQVAAAHNISVRQLYKIWSAQDVSFTQWIIAERLAAARQELATTPLGAVMVSTVARRWGFADPRHFARRFREAYGTSPAEWRRTLQRSS